MLKRPVLLIVLSIVLVTAVAGTASAQHNTLGYIFAGAGASTDCARCGGAKPNLGAGVERTMGFGLGVGAEGGYLRMEGKGFGLVSANIGYQFSRNARLSPFVSGGASLLFRDAALSFEGGSFQGGGNFGGGVNYWLRERIGLRVESRNYFFNDQYTFSARIGITFR